jgi:hypothetical protein
MKLSEDDVTFTLEETDSKGAIIAHVRGLSDTAELTFSKTSATLVIVDHTGVPDALTGNGLGTRLAEQMVKLARERGFKTMPLCPFYKAALSRHPDWQDVIA